jgi:hypothetical protein
MFQGHSKIVHRYNTNSGAQASEDSSELAAQQSCTGDLEPRGEEGEVLLWPWNVQFGDGYYKLYSWFFFKFFA